MRLFYATCLLLCFFGGLWLLPGTPFSWPARNPALPPILFHGLSSTLLGLALLGMAAMGCMALRQAARGHARATRQWQLCYLGTLAVSLTCLCAAVLLVSP